MQCTIRRRVCTLTAGLASWLAIVFWLGGVSVFGQTRMVNESAREIPLAYEVDVVVVGGSTGAVSAAVRAAADGAKVFLAAPRPYLGDDMTATLRLWLEEGEEPVAPLAREIFNDQVQVRQGRDPAALDFTYEADRPSASMHADSQPPGKLTDGAWSNPASQSVQFDGDVTIVADLGEPKPVREVRLMVYSRNSSDRPTGFKVQSVEFSTRSGEEPWSPGILVENKSTEDDAVLSAPVEATTRYVRLVVKKTDDCDRILLGEIEIVGTTAQPVAVEPPYRTPRPIHVKKTLDNALLEAGVEFLYSCFPTDVLRDAQGDPAGIVMANRAGRQAVVAKTIIDATDRAVVVRMAGAEFRPPATGPHSFRRVVIGGEICQGENLSARIAGSPFRGRYPNLAGTSSGDFNLIEYTLDLPLDDGGWASRAAADQRARSMTYHPEQQFTADQLFEIPPDPMYGRTPSAGPWQGVDQIPPGAFRPRSVDRIYVLGACADVSRPQAEKLLRPIALIDLGDRIGKAAATEAAACDRPKGVHLPGGETPDPAATGDVGEFLVGVRPIQELATVSQQARAIPVLADYDVVVIGGGTAGAPAGIAAARQGAKTLVVEYLHGLGGVGTEGAISKYYWGNRVGFSATVEGEASWVIERKMEWWRRQLLEAGADIWFGTIGCGAFVDNHCVKGAVVATPQGRGVVLAKVVIDTTGNSDVAVAAGAGSIYTDETELAMQGTGLPGRKLGETYTNTDFTITDETDIVDMWHLFVYSKDKYADAFDQGQLIDTRERRRIVGEFVMSLLDQVNGRTYPDTVVVSYSNFDTHGYTVNPYLELEHPGKAGFQVNVPYRCLLPKGLEGILVGGLGMSVYRDAVPLTRMQPDLQNQGYAEGVAAAMAAQSGVGLRQIDVRALQQHLIEIGNLPEKVLTDEEPYPMPIERIEAAVESVRDEFKGAAVLLAQPDDALPLLKEAYTKAQGNDKLIYSQILAVLGDATGLDTLIAEVDRFQEWDEGWNYRGMGQFGAALSPLDRLIVALGRTRRPEALAAILPKMQMLSADSDFSHHRAVGLACELIGATAAAKPLAEMLTQPQMTGYVHDTVEVARRRDQESPGGTNAVQTRRDSLRELAIARALYRCGDYGNLGKQILSSYTRDLRGHFARHAKAVLEAGNE
jgi:hypothetical protein